MAEPDWNPDTGGRSLAEILREAGIESAARSARRRRENVEDTGIRQRGAGPVAPSPEDSARFRRRRSDLVPEAGEPPAAPQRRAAAGDPHTAAIPGLRPERKPGVPAAAPSGATAATNGAPVRDREPGDRSTGRVTERPLARAAERAPERGHRRAADQRVAPRTAQSIPTAAVGAGAGPATGPQTARRPDGDFSTGPIPIVRADDDLEATPRDSALAWLRFGGELLIALAAGVGVYFAATVLWEMVPHLAVLLAPLAVTGLVAGVSVWRQRQGREPVGPRLLAVLVFAGTLLTIAPAASLLAAS